MAQVLDRKDGLTVKDREQWHKVLKWPDECESGFRANQNYYPPGGLSFARIGRGEYLVDIGCGKGSIFMYYRRDGKPARLLKFTEYDKAFGAEDAPYSKVYYAATSFNSKDRMLWIHSRTATENACLLHIYTFRRGQPVFIKSQEERCNDVL